MIKADIYIARHERYDAAEAYAEYLTQEQIEFLKETENEFWLKIDYEGRTSVLLEVADEG